MQVSKLGTNKQVNKPASKKVSRQGSEETSKPANKQGSEQANQQTGKPANWQASKQASQQTSKPANKQASEQARKLASNQTTQARKQSREAGRKTDKLADGKERTNVIEEKVEK